jgi:hypothetical protein
MSLTYNQVLPVNNKPSYTEFDSVDFQLDFFGQKLVSNSVKILADINITKSGSSINATDDIRLDGMIGAHSFIDSITTDFQNVGMVENIGDAYPRYVRMMRDTTMTKDDLMNSKFVAELCAPSDSQLTSASLAGSNCVNNARNDVILSNNVNSDFSIIPSFCLNNISTPDGSLPYLPYSLTGTIRINIKLSRVLDVLYGGAVDNSVEYNLSNLRVQFETVPDDGKVSNYLMNTIINIKSVVDSNFVNMSSRVPGVARAVSISFVEQDHETQPNWNNYETEKLPLLTEVKFLSNGSQDYITYDIDDTVEILERYIESFTDTGKNNMKLTNLKSNQSFGVGLDFGKYIDLSNQKFNVQLTSGVSSGNPYTAYLYFHTLVSL